MKTWLDCYPCFLRQALSAARRAGASEKVQRHILQLTMEELQHIPDGATPPEMAWQVHRVVREQTETADPFQAAKQQATEEALGLYSHLKQLVETAKSPLEMAVRIAIAGNIIDLGAADSYDLRSNLEQALAQDFAINDLSALKQQLENVSSILYLADNTGETVFDRVLIETLQKNVTYVVKAGPVINDATREDAVAAGLDKVADIIDNGSQAPGTLFSQCSADFKRLFDQAELIIAKGQGHYESLSDVPGPIFFLLKAKCGVIARNLDVAVGDIVVKQANTDFR